MAMENRTNAAHVLSIERTLEAPVEKVWRCWAEPELLQRWFCPEPWYVTDARIELQPGGEFSLTMNGPDGESYPEVGVFLAIEPMRRLVITDAFRSGWIPSERAFIVTEILFEDASEGRTHYIARAMHWEATALKEHEEMGFHEGWAKAADQLEALARSI